MKRFLYPLFLSPLAALLLATPALAHELVRDGNVGALLHIVPTDQPVTGKPNVTWIDLNMRGGKAIALAQCDCTLNVYAGAYREGARPLSTPKLRAEQGRIVTDLEFPREGAYTLVLTGKPTGNATYNAFRLEWVVRATSTGGAGGHSH